MLIDELREFVSRTGHSGITRYLPKNKQLHQWVLETTDHLGTDTPLLERIYCILNPEVVANRICDRGNLRRFYTFVKGYAKFCGNKSKCECAREHQRNVLTGRVRVEKKSRPKLDPEEKARRAKARMEHARKVFQERTGYSNAFQHPDVKKKIKETLQSRYGVEHPLQSEEIKKRVMATNLRKLGVAWPGQSEKNRKLTSRRSSIEIIGEENHLLLRNEEWMRSHGMTCHQLSEHLDVSYSTAYRAMREFGLVESRSSSAELSLRNFVSDLGFDVKSNSRMLEGIGDRLKEIDIWVPEAKLAIEYDGLYSHSEIGGKKDRRYQLKKKDAIKNQLGARSLFIFDDEFQFKPDIVRSRIKHALGLSEKGPGARSLDIKECPWSEVRTFYDNHHIQGSGPPGNCNIALYKNDVMVAAMTFSAPRRALGRESGDPELLRFCTDGKNYPGAASRLFSYYVRTRKPAGVISYADRRWSDGGLYQALGFVLEGTSGPNYWYTNDYRRRHHRFGFRKDVLVREFGANPKFTEWEIMQSLGYDRVWDCGSLKFRWTP